MSTEDRDTGEARSVIGRLGLLSPAAATAAAITRLGGLTNRVFRIDLGRDRYALRIPGKGTEEYINRAHEERAARATAAAGISPEVLHFDAASGVMVTRYVDGAVTMTPANFRSIPGAPGRAGAVLRRLHDSGAVFDCRFDLFAVIDGYLKVLEGKRASLPPGYQELAPDLHAVRVALSAHTLPIVACHCDPLCENFLDTGERMWLIDWEYSGMNDPLWDLGDVSVEGGFDAKQDEEMIRAYFGAEPRPAERGRIVIYQAMCDLLWALWGLIQHANQNPVEDFWAYANGRFGRCRTLMASAGFTRHVENVRIGK